MVLYFVATVFLSSLLLFSVQPMIAKSLLPVFGGASSVWTTCMLFYQTLLLLGYLYAHFVVKRVPWRAQLIGHSALLVLALVVGYIFDAPTAPPQGNDSPLLWLILQLLLVSGLPFFMISSAGPLVQSWFARAGHGRSRDPYFLYAASNTGNLIGLLAYPFILEPMLGIGQQRLLWLSGLGAFTILSAGAIFMSRRGNASDTLEAPTRSQSQAATNPITTGPITTKRRLTWIFWAFVPSSMLLGVTSHLSTDIASFPLLWVLPLAVYLITMIVAFGRDPGPMLKKLPRPMIVAVIGSIVLVLASGDAFAPVIPLVLVQLIALLLVGLMGHGRLAQNRPSADKLTEFYLLVSVGGALGGLFNGIVAPLLFETTLEYEIVLILALALLPRSTSDDPRIIKRLATMRVVLPIVSLVYVTALVLGTMPLLNAFPSAVMILFGAYVIVPALLTYVSWRDGITAALVASVPLAASVVNETFDPQIKLQERTFYGVHRVVDSQVDVTDPETGELRTIPMRTLAHGTTNHGVQYLDPVFETEPLGYYHFNGPCGAGLDVVKVMHPQGARMCVLGLGAGAVSSHVRAQDTMRFYELDPTVIEIAQDSGLFTYLERAGDRVNVPPAGDGRLMLELERDASAPTYDVILMDAFSSDSIPVHLVTREAVELYFERLDTDGVLMVHISNRYFDLHPLLFALSQEARAYAMIMSDDVIPDEEVTTRFSSVWMALTRSDAAAQNLLENGYKQMTKPAFEVRAWTDQYSNMLSVLTGGGSLGKDAP